jgi:RNA polymerase sigma-70 factor (ECF subfamily)
MPGRAFCCDFRPAYSVSPSVNLEVLMTKEGTPESWRRMMELLGPFHDQAAATARRLSRGPAEGDDLLQETVLRAWRKFDSLRDESRFRPWFYAILLSIHRNRCRGAFWKRFLSLEEQVSQGFEPPGPDGATWESERSGADRAARALATLPPEQREAIVLFEIDGFSIEEIAGLQHASQSAVKSRLSRGRERLRRHYERLGYRSRRDGAPAGEALKLSEGRRS